ncbi:unnamed protein product [Ixodes pacificus]
MTNQWQWYRVMLSRRERNFEHLVGSHLQCMACTGIALVAILRNLAYLLQHIFCTREFVCLFFFRQEQLGHWHGVVMPQASHVYRLGIFISERFKNVSSVLTRLVQKRMLSVKD